MAAPNRTRVSYQLAGLKLRAPHNEHGEKRCSGCGNWKSPDEFQRRRRAWDGRAGICKECLNARARASYTKRGRPAKRGHYHMTPEGSAAIARSVSKRMTGPQNPNWKGGLTQRTWRQTPEYHRWRNQVFRRDSYQCQLCGDDKGHNLTAHHIQSAEQHPELRYDLSNGMTVCELCHSQIHGHPVKGSRYKDTEMTICACGCQTPMKRWASRKNTRPRRYLPSHFIRVLHRRQRGRSDVTAAKI